MDVLAVGTQDVFHLAGLTPDLLEHVCRLLRDSRSLLHARQSCALLHRIVTSCMHTLLASDGYLPVEAWAAFPNATGLMIRLAKDENVELRRAHGRGCMGGFIDELPNDIKFSMTASDQHKLDVFIKVLSELPMRVRTIRWAKAPEIPVVDWRLVFTPSSKQSLLLARALVASACSQTLRSLQLDILLSTAAVDLLGAGLPALQHMDVVMGSTPKGNWVMGPSGLSLYASASAAAPAAADPEPSSDQADEEMVLQPHQQQQPAAQVHVPAPAGPPATSASPAAWAPVLPPHLTSLHLHCEVHSCALDASALAAAQQLRALALTGELELVHTAALSSLAELASLHLAPYDDGLSPWGRLRLLASLPALSHAALPMDCPVALLPERRSGPASETSDSQDDEQHEQEQEEGGLVAESLASLAGGRWDLSEVPEHDLPGCLARALPALRDFRGAATRQLPRLLAALQGHEQLTSLGASAWACDDSDWSAQLAALPQLRELHLHLGWYAAPQALQAAAACQQLQELVLDGGHKLPAVTAAAARALAAGACCSLRGVWTKGRQLHSWRRSDLTEISITAVAEMLKGRLVQLGELRLGGGGQAYRLQSCADELAGLLRAHEQQQGSRQQEGPGGGRETLQEQMQALADSAELTEALVQAARQAAGAKKALREGMASNRSGDAGDAGDAAGGGAGLQQVMAQLQQCSISSAAAGGTMQQPGQQQPVLECRLDAALLQRVQQACRARAELEGLLPARGSKLLHVQHRGCSISIALC